MTVFSESRRRNANPDKFVINLDAIGDLTEGQLLDALDAIFHKISDPNVCYLDEPNALPGAVLIVCRLKEIRSSALGGAKGFSDRPRSHWGNAEDEIKYVY